MEPRIVRTKEEIEKIERRCIEAERDGCSDFPAMTYEQGVAATIAWLLKLEAEPLFD